MEIIFYNDDYGLTHGFTDAIIDCATKGITTTSCVRVNGAAYAYAKKRLTTKVRKVVTGIHFNLTDGKPLNPRLADRQDNFKYSFGHYVLFLTNWKNYKPLLFKMLSTRYWIRELTI